MSDGDTPVSNRSTVRSRSRPSPPSGGGSEAGAPVGPVDRTASRLRTIRSIKRLTRAHLRPPPSLTVSQWADRYRRLTTEASAEAGQWRTERAPYQREIMDAFSNPEVEEVVVMSSAQVGKTEILLNVTGFFIDLDPCPILVVQPTLEMAEAWSKDRFAPMLRESPSLREKIPPAKSRTADNTIRHKSFPGGNVDMTGANSPASLASRPKRLVLQDEIDRFPPSAGSEGDPCKLADKRTAAFWNRKLGKWSTPTRKNFSRIEKAFGESDQRRFHVPCPHCGHMQVLWWRNVIWERGDPETAHMVCAGDEEGDGKGCGSVIEEADKLAMLQAGEWRATHPGRRIRGYHLNALYSPWRRWSEVVSEFLSSKDSPELLQTWINTDLGEPYEEDADRIDQDALAARREAYPAQAPAGVGLVTASVDVQGDRLEVFLVGWGSGEEHWLLEHHIIRGDPGEHHVWRELDELLLEPLEHESGHQLRARATAIDSGGHHTEQVYRFVQGRQRSRRVYAVKGMDGEGRPLVSRPKRIRKTRKVGLVLVGTVTAKDLIFTRMKIRHPGPGYLHLPDTLEEEVVAQLTAESVKTKWSHGRPRRTYVKDPAIRNEGLDLLVYSYAALAMLGPTVQKNLGAYAARLNARPVEKEEDPPLSGKEVKTEIRQAKRPKKRGRGWVGRY